MMLSENPNAIRPVLSIGRKPLALEAYRVKIGLKDPKSSTEEKAGLSIVPNVARAVSEYLEIQSATFTASGLGAANGNQNSDRQLARGRVDRSGDDKIEFSNEAGARHVSRDGIRREKVRVDCAADQIVCGDLVRPNASTQIGVCIGHRNFPSPLEVLSEPTPSPAREPRPFVHISGAVSTFPPSWTDAKGEEANAGPVAGRLDRAAMGREQRGRAAALNAWVARIAKEVGAAYSTKSERDAVTEFVRANRLSIANAFERRIVRKDVVSELSAMFEVHKSSET